MPEKSKMKFIEMTGKTLSQILDDGELHASDLGSAGVTDESIVRINQHGDIEVRRPLKWDCLLYTSPSPRDQRGSRMPSSA